MMLQCSLVRGWWCSSTLREVAPTRSVPATELRMPSGSDRGTRRGASAGWPSPTWPAGWSTWVSTVRGDRNSCSEIAALDSPAVDQPEHVELAAGDAERAQRAGTTASPRPRRVSAPARRSSSRQIRPSATSPAASYAARSARSCGTGSPQPSAIAASRAISRRKRAPPRRGGQQLGARREQPRRRRRPSLRRPATIASAYASAPRLARRSSTGWARSSARTWSCSPRPAAETTAHSPKSASGAVEPWLEQRPQSAVEVAHAPSPGHGRRARRRRGRSEPGRACPAAGRATAASRRSCSSAARGSPASARWARAAADRRSRRPRPQHLAVLDQPPRGSVEPGRPVDDQLILGQQHVGLAELDQQAELEGEVAGLDQGRESSSSRSWMVPSPKSASTRHGRRPCSLAT